VTLPKLNMVKRLREFAGINERELVKA
jgi:hypothetical protein